MISVVIPLYNKQESIYHTLQSVCEQTYPHFEVLVVNDGSTDNSAQVAASYLDTRIRIINKENGGVSSARNRGIQEAQGEYVAFLDGDDVWDKRYLEAQVRMISDFPDAAMWGINFAEMYNGKLIRQLATGLPDGFRGYVEDYFGLTKKGRFSDLFCSSSVVIRREVFDRVGYFDERIRYAEDTDMWWRIIARYPVAFYDRYMVFYQYDAENRAQNKVKPLSQSLANYVDKYDSYKDAPQFYQYAHHWTACRLRLLYFGKDEVNVREVVSAIKKLDYHVIPIKYVFLYKLPYCIAKWINILDLKR